ncbi:sialin-like [Schistocerca gregaria]|uniref:sialin-like n=1 Tax=Schistocerca gregaria TaxID=7010 RepID=UPI00211F32D4|nr:sialin-like [Schistocerca gregaria]
MSLKDRVTKRAILWLLIFVGCGVNYMIRANINIAIVAMVQMTTASDETAVASECIDDEFSLTGNYTLNSNITVPGYNVSTENRFDWDEHQQNMVIGGAFWLYWAGQLPGGTLAQYYGTKRVFGYSNLFCCVTTLLVPLFAHTDYRLLVALRVLQGVSIGLSWPSLNRIVSQWIPPDDRSKFMSSYMGGSIGTAVTFPLCGMLIHYLNWQSVFYVTSVIGIAWFVFWWWLVFDSPSQHPTITQKELAYIRSSLGDTVSERKFPIPWRKILTCRPLLIAIVADWGCLWGMYTLLTQAPTYLQNVQGWSVQMLGLVTGVPHIFRLVVGVLVGSWCDHLRGSGKLSVTNVRKLGTFVTNIVQGLFMLGLAFSGCNSVVAAICLTVALSASGAETAGPIATYVDLSPNFGGILMGIANTICVTPGVISAATVGYLTYKNQTTEQWKKVFLIASGALLATGVLHLLTSSAEIQEWNSPPVVERQPKSYREEPEDGEAQQRLTANPERTQLEEIKGKW